MKTDFSLKIVLKSDREKYFKRRIIIFIVVMSSGRFSLKKKYKKCPDLLLTWTFIHFVNFSHSEWPTTNSSARSMKGFTRVFSMWIKIINKLIKIIYFWLISKNEYNNQPSKIISIEENTAWSHRWWWKWKASQSMRKVNTWDFRFVFEVLMASFALLIY